MNNLEKLKKETFQKMTNNGDIAHNSDNENWVNKLIQTGYDYAMNWRKVEFSVDTREEPEYNGPIVFKYEYEWRGKLTGQIVYEFYENSNELVERLCGSCPNYTELLWKPI